MTAQRIALVVRSSGGGLRIVISRGGIYYVSQII
jgi:hypothetical protein